MLYTLYYQKNYIRYFPTYDYRQRAREHYLATL